MRITLLKHVFYLFLFTLSVFNPSSAADLYVNSTANAGVGTLRDQIALAAAGDRIIIDIKGDIVLSTPIVINNPIEIVGPFPVHSSISLSSLMAGMRAFDVQSGTLIIRGIGFTNSSSTADVGAISVNTGATVQVSDCLFENCSASVGAAIVSLGQLIVNHSGFINNTAGNEGGAIGLYNAAATATLINCTFSGNVASSTHGGAVRITNGANCVIRHCTFKNNFAFGLGDDVSVFGAGTGVTLHNNLFDNAAANAFANTSAPNFVSMGGNLFGISNPGYITTGPNDVFSASNINLGPLKTDGYGLKYHLIVSATSQAIDIGTAGSLPLTDCRRAPRAMFGTSNGNPDAGAVEFTPYSVISNSASGAGTFLDALNTINSTANPAPYFIDFRIALTPTIAPVVMLTLNRPTIIDGYSQEGSSIGGPGSIPNSLVSLTPSVTLEGNNTTVTGMLVNPAAGNSRIMGLKIQNYTNQGISISGATNVKIFGCMILGNDASGIEIAGGGGNFVGDSAYYNTNMISGNALRGVFINGSPNNRIMNNLIGTDQIGTSAMGTQSVGVEIGSAASSGNFIGGFIRFDKGNIISGNVSHQILLNNNSGGTVIAGNRIGTTYNGQSAINTFSFGITSTLGSSGNFMGGGTSDEHNIICAQGNGGIYLNASSNNVVNNNYIGYSPFPTGLNIPNGTGILIEGNASTGNSVGNTGARNYICGNTGDGIQITNAAANNTLNDNFIGIDHLNNIRPNAGNGVALLTSASANQIGVSGGGNYISGNILSGISVSAATGNFIRSNRIGLDSTTSIARANSQNGISISNGRSTLVEGNYISSNNGSGIEINSDSVLIVFNKIGTDISESLPMGNGSHGILINGNANRIGDGSTGDNSIVNNTLTGVLISGGINNALIKNSIYNNGQIGIDLNGGAGVTLNDATDADTGPNNIINYPDNMVAATCGSGTSFGGSFYGTAGVNYRIDVYETGVADASGHGEALSWLTSILITPSVTGNTPFTFYSPTAYANGTSMTATLSKFAAAGGYWETSEFATNFTVGTGISNSTASGNNITCFGLNNGAGFAVPGGGSTPYSFQWMTSGHTALTGQTNDTTYTLSAGSYYCIITDASGCPDSTALITITEPAAIVTTANFTSPTCNASCDASITITASGGVSPFQYSNDNGISYQAPNTFTGICAGTYSQLMVQDVNGCTALVSAVTITDPPILSSTSTLSDESCPGFCDGSISLTAAGGVAPLLFSIDNGSTFQASGTFTGLCTGTYNTVISDANGCQITQAISIGTNIVLQANAGPDDNVCAGSAYTLDGSASINASTYDWFESGTAVNLGNTASILVNPTATTSYVLTISGGGCTHNDTVTLNIITPPDPDIQYAFSPGDTILICESGNGLSPSSVVTPGGTFSTTGGLPIDALSGAVTFTGMLYGLYNIYYTTAQCNLSDTIIVYILPDPTTPTTSQADFTMCNGGTIPTLVADTTGMIGAMVWYGTSALTIPIAVGPAYTPGSVSAGFNDYFISQSYSNCKSPGTAFSITVVGNNLLVDNGTVVVCPDQSAQLNVSASTGTMGAISWSPGNSLNDSTIANPLASPTQNTTYYYNTSIDGCSLSDSVTVEISNDPNCVFDEMYTAFSPDDDGVNDTWIITAALQHPDNKVIIFNRWGDKLREFDNYNNVDVVWDGTYNNQKLPSGTYFYVIRYNDINQHYSGWIHLTR